MKTLEQLRPTFDFYPETIVSRIKYLKNLDLDFDVYLPTYKRNLQREFVWTLDQQRELIWSVVLQRHIPFCALINSINKEDETKDKYLVIDGKQRILSIFKFMEDEFSIEIEGEEYCYDDLPSDYKLAISNYNLSYYVVNESWNDRITDEQKLQWFKFINFAGTPQDKKHLDSFKKWNTQGW